MAKLKPVTISKSGFAFCRITIALMLSISLVFQIKWLISAVFIIMLWSAVSKVKKAPLILLSKFTIEKIWPSEDIIVDENGIYYSHLIGALFSLICLGMLYLVNPIIGWIITGLFTILQISAACGFCSVLKVYSCMANGTCCRFGKYIKGDK